MKTEKDIRILIAQIKQDYHHVLYMGSPATIEINRPRALMQIHVLCKLETLYWVLGEKFEHKYPKVKANT